MNISERLFPLYHNHSFIKSIENNCRWTISDKNKIPVNARVLIEERRIIGATTTDNTCLMTLPELCENIEHVTGSIPANNAYYLDALIDNWVVLDIEPKCPKETLDRLLALPYIYGELSLSGKGVHLIFPMPEIIKQYPIAQKKIAFKEEHGWYEILLCHWVTFTRKVIQPYNGDTSDQSAFIELFRRMASEQKESIKSDITVTEFENLDIPGEEDLISLLGSQKYNKTLDSFNGDHSRYEFNYAMFLARKLEKLLCVTSIQQSFKAMNYSPEMLINIKAYLIYKTMLHNLEPRAKWGETRGGLPLLLYTVQNAIGGMSVIDRKGDK